MTDLCAIVIVIMCLYAINGAGVVSVITHEWDSEDFTLKQLILLWAVGGPIFWIVRLVTIPRKKLKRLFDKLG